MDSTVKPCSWGRELTPSEVPVDPCPEVGEKEVYLTDEGFSLWLCPSHELELDLVGVFE